MKNIISEESKNGNDKSKQIIRDCSTCMFRDLTAVGELVCLMDSVKSQWQTSTVSRYCDDTFARKFVGHWNSLR
jgi:hypothetical protein